MKRTFCLAGAFLCAPHAGRQRLRAGQRRQTLVPETTRSWRITSAPRPPRSPGIAWRTSVRWRIGRRGAGSIGGSCRRCSGLWPMPERTDLKPVITGKLEQPEFTVEKLYFQALPKLYVTANLYLPKKLEQPAPAILYVCGHSRVITNGVSCGNKAAYQRHGAWFARNGYVCLVIDTLQLRRDPGAASRHLHATGSGGGTAAATPPPGSRRGSASARWITCARARRWTRSASA